MPTLLVIGYVWPEPTSSAAGSRMMQLLQFFQTCNYEIVFATTARKTNNKVDLSSLGIKEQKIKLNDSGFDDFIKKIMPEIVLFDRFMMEEQFGWRIDKICPDALKILDTEDLHFLRDARQEAYKHNISEAEIYLDSDLAKREIAAIYRSDLSLIISEVEMNLLQSQFNIPENVLFYLPFMLKPVSETESSKLPAFENRKGFINVGNFLHEPNWKAVLFLKENIWPGIRKKLPEAQMHIYGAYPSQKVFNLHNEKENFLVHGWAEDSKVVMQKARICLAPILFGAGLKGKLVEAMQCGTPSITTYVGAEGINANLEWSGFICDDNEEFVAKAVALYSDEDLWENKQKFGFHTINQRFNKDSHFKLFRQKLKNIQENLKNHRDLNFTGKMLKHHLHRSTYFMSKFIEEKNRNKN